jgi:hypothetical protein
MANTVDALDIIVEVWRLAFDDDEARFQRDVILKFINDGQLQAVMINPKVNAVSSSVQLTTGILQTLPTGGIKLLNLLWNMVTNGTTQGAFITKTTREVLTKRIPTWTTDTANGVVQCYIYEEFNPTQFDVYPAQPSTATYVQILYSKIPSIIPDSKVGTKITIPDYWKNALIYYCAYKCFDEDSEYSNETKRDQYMKMFLSEVTESSQQFNGYQGSNVLY